MTLNAEEVPLSLNLDDESIDVINRRDYFIPSYYPISNLENGIIFMSSDTPSNTLTSIHNPSTLQCPHPRNSEHISYDISEEINNIRISNPKKIIIGHLNINSIRNKIDGLKVIIKGIDIFAVTESKLDDSFPISQFNIDGFREPFRKDRSSHGGGIYPHEIICLELNFRKVNWLLIIVYYPRPHPGRKHENEFLFDIGKAIDFKDYQKIVVIGDINLEQHNDSLAEFMTACNLSNLIKEPTCYKTVNYPTSIDVILTNKPKSFQSTSAFTSGLSGFHKLILTV